MLSLQDCVALCGLTEAEVRAIAQHANLPEVVAAELGNYLAHTASGERTIKAMIKDDLAVAAAAGDARRALGLKLVLREFVLCHPACDERLRAKLRLPERRLT
jgi:hypothetical protein